MSGKVVYSDSAPALLDLVCKLRAIPTILVNKNVLDIYSTGTADVVKTMFEFSIVTN